MSSQNCEICITLGGASSPIIIVARCPHRNFLIGCAIKNYRACRARSDGPKIRSGNHGTRTFNFQRAGSAGEIYYFVGYLHIGSSSADVYSPQLYRSGCQNQFGDPACGICISPDSSCSSHRRRAVVYEPLRINGGSWLIYGNRARNCQINAGSMGKCRGCSASIYQKVIRYRGARIERYTGAVADSQIIKRRQVRAIITLEAPENNTA